MLNDSFNKLYKNYKRYLKINGTTPPYIEEYRDLHISSLLVIVESLANDHINRYRNPQVEIDKDDLISVGLACAIRYVDKYIKSEKSGLNTASLSSFAYKQIQYEINKYCITMRSVVSFSTDNGHKEYDKYDVRSDENTPVLENLGYTPSLEMLESDNREEDLFKHLQDWEREIVFQHFGIGICGEPKNFNEISENTDFSPREIGYIVKKSLRKLKTIAEQNRLTMDNFSLFLSN